MSRRDLNPLLKDLMADSDYGRFRAELKARALDTLRTRRRVGRCIRSGVLGIALALAFLGLHRWPGPLSISRPSAPAQIGATANRPVRQRTTPSRAVQTINDQQLLACFPPDTCALAEVNGEKVLIFFDPALRARVMR
jgi:hypothetical protein